MTRKQGSAGAVRASRIAPISLSLALPLALILVLVAASPAMAQLPLPAPQTPVTESLSQVVPAATETVTNVAPATAPVTQAVSTVTPPAAPTPAAPATPSAPAPTPAAPAAPADAGRSERTRTGGDPYRSRGAGADDEFGRAGRVSAGTERRGSDTRHFGSGTRRADRTLVIAVRRARTHPLGGPRSDVADHRPARGCGCWSVGTAALRSGGLAGRARSGCLACRA